MNGFEYAKQEMVGMVQSEIQDIDYRIDERDPALFGTAGLLGSVSEYRGKLCRLLCDVEEAKDSWGVSELRDAYIDGYEGV